MSFVAKDKDGKRVYRRRPSITVTVSPAVLDSVVELEELSGWGRSRCVEEALKIGVSELLRRFRMVRPSVSNEGEVFKSGEDEYMRKLIFDVRGVGWEQV